MRVEGGSKFYMIVSKSVLIPEVLSFHVLPPDCIGRILANALTTVQMYCLHANVLAACVNKADSTPV